jgi:hypothetical protein
LLPTFLTKYNSFSLDTKTKIVLKKNTETKNKIKPTTNKKRETKTFLGVKDGNPGGKGGGVESGGSRC